MGFDDISSASFVSQALTTMKRPQLHVGVAAMDMLLELQGGKTPERSQVLLRAELILRDSVRPRRAPERD